MATFNLKKGYDLNLKGKPQKEIISISTPDIIKINPSGECKIIDKAPSGRMYLDGNIGVSADSQSIKERKNISINGYLEVTLILSNNGKMLKPIVSYKGIPENEIGKDFIIDMEDEINNVCRTFSIKNKKQEFNLIDAVKKNCRKFIKEKTGKKPYTNINIARIWWV